MGKSLMKLRRTDVRHLLGLSQNEGDQGNTVCLSIGINIFDGLENQRLVRYMPGCRVLRCGFVPYQGHS
ncbi:hypothetical protein N5D77_20925 [Comamonas thiooxydans]|uniref:Uncharacterized protein n=1 Tax=Comamonas thiooxydans TaxID=363952 RepID=A0AA42Q3D0_9BURK|nr:MULTISPECIES: hypothetical protein [Comamonas]MDH1336508.1 hypothetical protein [Comamonas thiooxydans]MDH1742599.1 hypothetical protein [Comamonas thiooxydans]MDH1789042.1 hypothetical protein [Comamonas thiooxydans]TFF56184.1 hypothetical protein EIC84_21110 [Comamonas sp. A23]